VNDRGVGSWAELQDRLFQGSWNEQLGRFRSSFAFRGLSDARYELKTSLIRLGGAYHALERHLLRNFRKYAHREAVPADSEWNWLATAQHYGLPTRLLDWTYSPYAALHFATANIEKFHLDGVIWCVDYRKAHERLPAALRDLLEEEGANVVTAEILGRFARSLRELDAAGGDFVIFFEPPSIDDRIVNQHALFSLMPSNTAMLDRWLAGHPDLYHRILIPAPLKWEIRDKLDQSNITERVLFPGLEGLSRWLRRHYSPSA
jgi:hypothetical protein